MGTMCYEYNGWRNYPTWAVHLWLTNDPGTDDDLMRIARETTSRVLDIGNGETYTTTRAHEVADAIQEYVEDMTATDGANMSSDLLGWAVAQCDWDEIARAAIETVGEG